MSSVLADTHTAIWYFGSDPRLSENARRALNQSLDGGYPILLASISLVEMTYLVEKKRIAAEARTRMTSLLKHSARSLRLAPLDLRVAEALERVDRSAVPELPDRVIAATALALGIPLVTCDHMIRASGVPTIW
jgi:PIN domain nuclease of toxin-antitoxin system